MAYTEQRVRLAIIAQHGQTWVEDEHNRKIAIDPDLFANFNQLTSADGDELFKTVELIIGIDGPVSEGSHGVGPSLANAGGFPAEPSEMDVNVLIVCDAFPPWTVLSSKAADIVAEPYLNEMINRAIIESESQEHDFKDIT